MKIGYICIIAMFLSSICYGKTLTNKELVDKVNTYWEVKTLYAVENSKLRSEIEELKEQRALEKKVVGISGLLLFASGNESLKNIGLVSLFAWSIW